MITLNSPLYSDMTLLKLWQPPLHWQGVVREQEEYDFSYHIILVGFLEDSIEYRLQLQLQNETINLW